jgi:hypothetical protein
MRVNGIGAVVACVCALGAGAGGSQWALAADQSTMQPRAGSTTSFCPTTATPAQAQQRPTAPGNVTAAIPRYTFIDEQSGAAHVWTNTNEAPSAQDSFVVLLAHGSQPASSTLVSEVLARCH